MARPVRSEYAPTVTNHGGLCCGIRHVFRFGAHLNNDPDELTRLLDREIPFGRLIEITLTLAQIRQCPRTLQKMADLGFVLVGYFNNHNSGSSVAVFHLAPSRLPLASLVDENLWTGQVLTPTMGGNLIELESMNSIFQEFVRPIPMSVGSHCQIASPRSRYLGQTLMVIEKGTSPISGNSRSRFEDATREGPESAYHFWVLDENLVERAPAPLQRNQEVPRYLPQILAEDFEGRPVRHPQQ